MAAALLLKQQRGLDVVGLDAADVVGFLGGGGRALATAAAALGRGGGRLLTLLARFSTSEIMEVLKSVAAVRGRLVTSVMLSLPSGHMTFSTGLELEAGATQHSRRVNDRKWLDCMFTFKLRAGRRWSVVGGAFLSVPHLLYKSLLKSWNRVSLFLSMKPTTEYLWKQKRRSAVRYFLSGKKS